MRGGWSLPLVGAGWERGHLHGGERKVEEVEILWTLLRKAHKIPARFARRFE
jgi:hypothetical protein